MKNKWLRRLSVLCFMACIIGVMPFYAKADEKKEAAVTYDEETKEFLENLMSGYEASGYDMSGFDLDSYASSLIESSFVSGMESTYLNADREDLEKLVEENEEENASAASYLQATEGVGKYQSEISDYVLDIDEESGVATLSGVIKFEKKDVTFMITMDMNTDETTYTFEKVSSFGEKMQKAALNTVMGMGTVFVVLIFISLLIGCFGLFNKSEIKKEQPQQPAALALSVPEEEEDEEEDVTQDLELVAVISAAIAAAEGTSVEGFQVRSIKKAKRTAW